MLKLLREFKYRKLLQYANSFNYMALSVDHISLLNHAVDGSFIDWVKCTAVPKLVMGHYLGSWTINLSSMHLKFLSVCVLPEVQTFLVDTWSFTWHADYVPSWTLNAAPTSQWCGSSLPHLSAVGTIRIFVCLLAVMWGLVVIWMMGWQN